MSDRQLYRIDEVMVEHSPTMKAVFDQLNGFGALVPVEVDEQKAFDLLDTNWELTTQVRLPNGVLTGEWRYITDLETAMLVVDVLDAALGIGEDDG